MRDLMSSLNTGRSTVEMAAAFQCEFLKKNKSPELLLLPPALPAKQKKREKKKADMKNAKAHEGKSLTLRQHNTTNILSSERHLRQLQHERNHVLLLDEMFYQEPAQSTIVLLMDRGKSFKTVFPLEKFVKLKVETFIS